MITIREEEVPDHLKISLFRIIQEAMNNIGKHAKADHMRLGLRKVDTAIELSIRDNGKGFDQETLSSEKSLKKGLGLSSMRERTEFSEAHFPSSRPKEGGRLSKPSGRFEWPSQNGNPLISIHSGPRPELITVG